MPLSKATKYKRFNVGTYMKEMRIASQDIEAKNKTLGAKRKQLNRIEEKVRKHILSLQLFKNITYCKYKAICGDVVYEKYMAIVLTKYGKLYFASLMLPIIFFDRFLQSQLFCVALYLYWRCWAILIFKFAYKFYR